MMLIPAIDLRQGRCVRLFQGDFGAETRYDWQPESLLDRYAGFGASWVHVVDLDGAKDGSLTNRSIIVDLASRGSIRLQVGGGIRSAAAIEDLLGNGVARVVIGSAGVERPDEVAHWLGHYGPERVCLALDVRLDAEGTPRVQTRGWTEGTTLSLWEALVRFEAGTLRHVLCTDIARDGALTGPNLQLYEEAVRRFPAIRWQASGGIRNAFDLAALARTGVAGAVSGKALLEQRISHEELRPFLHDASSPASTCATGRS
jgi:phosphoribosylformimino-5-aminoimidazole carboxamide ribotide isomerase